MQALNIGKNSPALGTILGRRFLGGALKGRVLLLHLMQFYGERTTSPCSLEKWRWNTVTNSQQFRMVLCSSGLLYIGCIDVLKDNFNKKTLQLSL